MDAPYIPVKESATSAVPCRGGCDQPGFGLYSVSIKRCYNSFHEQALNSKTPSDHARQAGPVRQSRRPPAPIAFTASCAA